LITAPQGGEAPFSAQIRRGGARLLCVVWTARSGILGDDIQREEEDIVAVSVLPREVGATKL